LSLVESRMLTRPGSWIASILRIARTVYALAALGCIITAGLGICAVLYFEILVVGGPTHVTVPPPYVASAPVIDLHTVESRLQVPTNVRFVVTRPFIDKPIQDEDVLGYFAANTANRLADFPDDFEILGGKDAGLFDRRGNVLSQTGGGTAEVELLRRNIAVEASRGGQRAVLVSTPELRQQIDKLLPTLKAQERRTYTLQVAARDAYGIYSAPTDVSVVLTFSPAAAVPIAAPIPQAAPSPQMSDLQRLAHEIALVVDKEGMPANRQAYDVAMREPEDCGTSQADLAFVGNYRRAFDSARPKLLAANLPAFYDGVCNAWRRALSEQGRARAEVEAARNAAMSRNQAAQIQNQIDSVSAQAGRSITLIVVGSAIAAFLTVSLVLAFLAIENHSRATREAISRLTEARHN
jgi:hypothetical protein